MSGNGYGHVAQVYGHRAFEAGCLAVWERWLTFRLFARLPLSPDRLRSLVFPFGMDGAQLWELIPYEERRHPAFSVWQTKEGDGGDEEAALVVHPDNGPPRVVVRWAHTSPKSFGEIVESAKDDIYAEAYGRFSSRALMLAVGSVGAFFAAAYFFTYDTEPVAMALQNAPELAFLIVGVMSVFGILLVYKLKKEGFARRALDEHPASKAAAEWRKTVDVLLKPKPVT